MQSQPNRELHAALMLVAAALFWGGNAVAARVLVGDIPPVALSFWRWLVALLILLPFAWPHVRRQWGTIRTNLPLLTLLALLATALFNSLLYGSALTTQAVNIALLSAAMPILIGLVAWLLIGERPTPYQIGGIVAALPGVLMIISEGSLETLRTLTFVPGDLIMSAAVVCWSLYSVLLRRHPLDLHPTALLASLIALGLPFVSMAYLVELSLGHTMAPDTTHLLTFGYVAIFPSLLAYLGWNHGVRVLGASRAGMFMYLVPVFGAILAILLLNERLGWHHTGGGLLILIGLYLATRGR